MSSAPVTPANSEEEQKQDFFDEDVVFTRKNNIRAIKRASVAVQVRKVNRLSAQGVDVRDVPSTLAHIASAKWAANTKNGYLQALASVFVVFPELQEQYKAYSAASVAGRKKITKAAEKSRLSPKEVKFPKWSEINELYLKAQSIYDRALMGIYTLLPPRRVADVASLVYAPGSSSLDPNFLSADYGTLTFADYKTARTFGVVEIAVPAALQELLEELEREPGERVFNDVKNFSRHVSKTFASVSDIHITANILRHSFVSHFLSKPRSTQEKKLVGRMTGHGLITQQNYLRMELTQPAVSEQADETDTP